jgi:hypothetical protein
VDVIKKSPQKCDEYTKKTRAFNPVAQKTRLTSTYTISKTATTKIQVAKTEEQLKMVTVGKN